MSDASELIAQQIAAAGITPGELTPVGSVTKTYVDQQDALLQSNINGSNSLAASAQQTADTALSRAKMGFSQVNNIPAAAYGDQFFLVGGIGITVSTNPTTKEVTITATGNAAPAAHASTHIPGGSDPIQTATTSRYGLAQYTDSTSSTSTTTAGTANSVRLAKAEAQGYVDARPWQKYRLTEDTGMATNIIGQNLNNYMTAGFFAGHTLTNAPDGEFYYLEVQSYIITGYVVQILKKLYSNVYRQRVYTTENGWSTWSDDVFDAIFYIPRGNGSPEGVLTRPVGSLYLRKDGGTNTTLYVKQSGTGNTGWVAK